jgi:hypothetical protein
MIEDLLSQLPIVAIAELEDKRCVIFTEEYGTVQPHNGLVEHSVRFVCGHVVGSECIEI